MTNTAAQDFPTPMVNIAPVAHAKMIYLCNKHNCEVGGWGVAKDPDNPLQIDEIYIPTQTVGPASIDFDDVELEAYKTEMAAQGYQYDQFFRVWIHTQPGKNTSPSDTDLETFRGLLGHIRNDGDRARALDKPELAPDPWLIMAIIAASGDMYAEIGYFIKFGFIRGHIDIASLWADEHLKEWDTEYKDSCTTETVYQRSPHFGQRQFQSGAYGEEAAKWWADQPDTTGTELATYAVDHPIAGEKRGNPRACKILTKRQKRARAKLIAQQRKAVESSKGIRVAIGNTILTAKDARDFLETHHSLVGGPVSDLSDQECLDIAIQSMDL